MRRLALQRYELKFDEILEPDGRLAYRVRPGKLTECAEDDDTDEKAMRDGYVVITPLTYDITDRAKFGLARQMFEKEGSV